MPALTPPDQHIPTVSVSDTSLLPFSSASQETTSGRVRLHITPFTPELLARIIPPSLQQHISHISYHTVQTFPEKGFGYVEMPKAEAEKLKKKLNGSILKGEKVKIQDARPEKRKRNGDGADDVAELDNGADAEKIEKKKKKRKVTEKIEEGVELPEGRLVKRGWTEPVAEKKKSKKSSKEADKTEKKREKSKFIKEPEMLFRTELPPTAATSKAMAESEGKKKSKDEKKEKKKQRRSSNDVVVHEFENTKKHASFLKDTNEAADSKPAAEYIEGKGWVDAKGTVVEAVRKTKRKKRKKHEEKDSDKQPEAPLKNVAGSEPGPKKDADETMGEASTTQAGAAEPSPTTEAKEVHPLEALFKRPKPSSAKSSPTKPPPIDTSRARFSFFAEDVDAGAEDEDTADSAQSSGKLQPSLSLNPPVTPHTRRDLEWRGLRSAAPEPDTAVGEKKFTFGNELGTMDEQDEEDDENESQPEENVDEAEEEEPDQAGEDEEMDVVEEAAGKTDQGEKEESEFSKWFWEHRGETNRAWKHRRRETMKTKRQRENRRLGGARRP